MLSRLLERAFRGRMRSLALALDMPERASLHDILTEISRLRGEVRELHDQLDEERNRTRLLRGDIFRAHRA